ncbi:hypothetical protein EVAR_54518_1 [Eumeta japonica]|uniref:Uncharacterized protein n=1 Tax=Eumeta variegata TaxID=151549 RepID=A0A4C1YM65_EUMVA|nr:hypothetical protein EVAR_54518_1 [Eumeta japonica]
MPRTPDIEKHASVRSQLVRETLARSLISIQRACAYTSKVWYAHAHPRPESTISQVPTSLKTGALISCDVIAF